MTRGMRAGGVASVVAVFAVIVIVIIGLLRLAHAPEVAPEAAAAAQAAPAPPPGPPCIHEVCSDRPAHLKCVVGATRAYCDDYWIVYEHHCDCDKWGNL